jgi:hypothetical protein
MEFAVAEVKKRHPDWYLFLSTEMGPLKTTKTRRAALEFFRDRYKEPSRPTFLLIYGDLDYLAQVWLFRKGRKPRRLPLASWQKTKSVAS